MIRVILRWLAERFQEGGRLQKPMTLTLTSGKVELTFFSDAKAENGKAYVGGYLWNGHEVLSWYAAEVLPSWAPWAFIKNDEMVSEKEAAKQRRRGGHVSTGTVRKAKRARTKW